MAGNVFCTKKETDFLDSFDVETIPLSTNLNTDPWTDTVDIRLDWLEACAKMMNQHLENSNRKILQDFRDHTDENREISKTEVYY